MLFNQQKHSRDVYHAKRMFRVESVLWSGDGKFITSGSSDHNVRVWKANASEKMGAVSEIGLLLPIRLFKLLCFLDER